jgi:hypothetical protein
MLLLYAEVISTLIAKLEAMFAIEQQLYFSWR